MKKMIVVSAIAALLVLALTGCSFTSTVTRTETVTDANGNTTTHTSVTTNDNGNVTTSETVEVSNANDAAKEEEMVVSSIAFNNETGMTLSGVYFSSANSDDWGNNLLGEDTLESGYTITFSKFEHRADAKMWDCKIVNTDGQFVEFKGLNLDNAADPANIVIHLTAGTEAGNYTVYVE